MQMYCQKTGIANKIPVNFKSGHKKSVNQLIYTYIHVL
jgi:hypothetical protein